MKRILIWLCLLLLPVVSLAAEWNPSTCSQSDVQSAITSASDGDTINIPAGECTWSSAVTVPSTKGLTITGAGRSNTTIVDDVGGDALFIISVGAGAIDISNMSFDGNGSASTGAGSAIIKIDGVSTDNSNIRIHHIDFTDHDKRSIVVVSGENEVYVLIDNCTFTTSESTQTIAFMGKGVNSTWWWDNVSSELGTADFNFVEDCSFDYTGVSVDNAVDMYGGAKAVVRHNTFRNIRMAFHGTDSGNYVSPLAWELYENTFLNHRGSEDEGRAFLSRGGTGVVHNNTWESGYSAYLDLLLYRATGTYDNWEQCDGSSSWDQNSDTNGTSGTASSGGTTSMVDTGAGWSTDEWAGFYVHNTSEGTATDADCVALINSNTSDTLTLNAQLGSGCSGDSTFADTETYIITDGYPCLGQQGRGADISGLGNYPLEPLYEWDNTIDGADIDWYYATAGTRIQENRDYYNDTEKPDYTAYTYPHPLRGKSLNFNQSGTTNFDQTGTLNFSQ